MKQGAVGLLWAVLILTTTWTAQAEEPSSSAHSAAGWAIVGIGSSIGFGSVATGTVLLVGGKQNDETLVGAATLAGGGATILLSVIIGVPLILNEDDPVKKREVALDALAGRFRW